MSATWRLFIDYVKNHIYQIINYFFKLRYSLLADPKLMSDPLPCLSPLFTLNGVKKRTHVANLSEILLNRKSRFRINITHFLTFICTFPLKWLHLRHCVLVELFWANFIFWNTYRPYCRSCLSGNSVLVEHYLKNGIGLNRNWAAA